MPRFEDSGQNSPSIDRLSAFRHFAEFDGRTQSQKHNLPLHRYITCRLVLEGGLKTKNVDIVVNKEGIGPVLAISCKGMTGAVRNLTNRLEETIGECTNIHIGYPTLVFGYLFVVRANQDGGDTARTDAAIDGEGKPVEAIVRFHQALVAMSGRQGIRDDPSSYEAIAMAMVEVDDGRAGQLVPSFPPKDSPIHFDRFFKTLYQRYDERYVVSAPLLATKTRRREWSTGATAEGLEAFRSLDYSVRDIGR